MEIDFELTREDYWAFTKHAIAQNRGGSIDLISLAMPYVLAFLLGRVYRWSWDCVFVLTVVGGSVMLALQLWYGKKRTMTLVDGDQGSLGRKTIRIAPEGLFTSSAVSECRRSWSGVRKICHTYEHLFIYIDRAEAHVIPKRAFPNLAAAKRFADQAKAYMDQARASTQA